MTLVHAGVGSAAACETMGQVQLDGSAVIHSSPQPHKEFYSAPLPGNREAMGI